MKKSKRVLGSDLAKIDAHVITAEEYEEIPEWTDEMFEQADLYHGDTLIRRGRPRKEVEDKKVSIHLRVDPDVAAAFRASGKGWQTRANAILKAWVAAHPNG